MNTTDTTTIKQHAATTLERARDLTEFQRECIQPMLAALAEDIAWHFKEVIGSNTTALPWNEDWWGDYLEVMYAAGFNYGGMGYFSAEFHHTRVPGRIFAVTFDKELVWRGYVAFCEAHKNQDGVPAVYSVNARKGCYVVVMDATTKYAVKPNMAGSIHLGISSGWASNQSVL